jgi:hypothetical protein
MVAHTLFQCSCKASDGCCSIFVTVQAKRLCQKVANACEKARDPEYDSALDALDKVDLSPAS